MPKHLIFPLALALFFLPANPLQAQSLSRQKVDSLTLSLYALQAWPTLSKAVSQARKAGIDGYIFRVRGGYALYQQGRYRKAAREFRKGQTFFPADTVCALYRHLSLLLGGQHHAAYVAGAALTASCARSAGFRRRPVLETGVWQVAAIFNSVQRLSTSYEVVPNSRLFSYDMIQGGGAYVLHPIIPRLWLLHLIGAYPFQGNISTINTQYQPTTAVRGAQVAYTAVARYQLTDNLMLGGQFAFNHLTSSAVSFTPGQTTQPGQPPVGGGFSSTNTRSQAICTGGFAEYQTSFLDLRLTGCYNRPDSLSYQQISLSVNAYPLGNLRLVASGDASLVRGSQDTSRYQVYRLKLKGMISKNITLGAGVVLGDLHRYADPENRSVLYLADHTRFGWTGSALLLLGLHARIGADYQFVAREGFRYAIPGLTMAREPSPFTYASHQLTTSFSWTF